LNITHIRNATLIVEYANKKFLIDPMLGEKGSFAPFPDAPRDDQNNPLVELPISVDEIISDIDYVILTHLHLDHFDEAAQNILPKDIKIYTQNEEDAEEVRKAQFNNVEALESINHIDDIELIKTPGQHGRGPILEVAGNVCGLIFKNSNEQTLYVAGDTVWYEEVEKTLNAYKPDIVVVNGGDNQFHQGGSLVMNETDIQKVVETSPQAKIIVVHMEAVNHWNLSRKDLKQYAISNDFDSHILIPEDGDKYNF
jgi:L-ascorbate metabolism protein UlaG (beta-lactamase superfamily)